MSCCFPAWQMVIPSRCSLDGGIPTVTVEPLQTGHPPFLILSHTLTLINFHPSTDILIPSRSAHKPAMKLFKAHLQLSTAYPNIDKHKCTPKMNKAIVNQPLVAWDKEIWDLYSQLFCVLCFGLWCLCVVSPTGRASIPHIFDLTNCTHLFQPQATVISALTEIGSETSSTFT